MEKFLLVFCLIFVCFLSDATPFGRPCRQWIPVWRPRRPLEFLSSSSYFTLASLAYFIVSLNKPFHCYDFSSLLRYHYAFLSKSSVSNCGITAKQSVSMLSFFNSSFIASNSGFVSLFFLYFFVFFSQNQRHEAIALKLSDFGVWMFFFKG